MGADYHKQPPFFLSAILYPDPFIDPQMDQGQPYRAASGHGGIRGRADEGTVLERAQLCLQA